MTGMGAAGRSRYDEARLLKTAGEKVFARGRIYADQGQVVLLSLSASGVLAAAFGTDDYTVWLKRRGPDVSGHCTCPAFDDSGLCKHMVATALLANRAAEGGGGPDDLVGRLEARIAAMDPRQVSKLLLEAALENWRTLRSLHCALGLDWDHEID